MNEEAITSLKYARLKIPRLIPAHLIDAVKFKGFDSEKFYAYQEDRVGDPDNLIFALFDNDKKIKGYLWAVVDESDGALFINTFSVDKEHWGKGKAMDKAIEIIEEIVDELKPPSVKWITTNDRFFVKRGFKRSREVIMEYVVVPHPSC
jgi:hypothetical protein